MASVSTEAGTVEDQELISAVSSWAYREYTHPSSSCYDARRFLKTSVSGGSLSIYDHLELSRGTSSVGTRTGAYTCLWIALRWSSSVVVLNTPDWDMPFVRYITTIE